MNINDILKQYYLKNSQTRVATGGAQGANEEELGKVVQTKLAIDAQRAYQMAREAEQKRQFNETLKQKYDYLSNIKRGQNMAALSMIGTIALGKSGEIGKWFEKKPAFEIPDSTEALTAMQGRAPSAVAGVNTQTLEELPEMNQTFSKETYQTRQDALNPWEKPYDAKKLINFRKVDPFGFLFD